MAEKNKRDKKDLNGSNEIPAWYHFDQRFQDEKRYFEAEIDHKFADLKRKNNPYRIVNIFLGFIMFLGIGGLIFCGLWIYSFINESVEKFQLFFTGYFSNDSVSSLN